MFSRYITVDDTIQEEYCTVAITSHVRSYSEAKSNDYLKMSLRRKTRRMDKFLN